MDVSPMASRSRASDSYSDATPVDGNDLEAPSLPAEAPSPRPATPRQSTVEPRWQWRYRTVVAATDVVVIALAVMAGQLIRFGVNEPGVSGLKVELSYTALSVILAAAWNGSLAMSGAWHRKIIGTGTLAYGKVAKATFLVFGLLAGVSYLGKLEIARGYVAITLPVGLVVLLLGRMCWRAWLLRARRQGRLMSPTVVVGSGERALALARQLTREPLAGYRVVGVCVPEDDAALVAGEFQVLGSFEDVLAVAQRTDAAIIAVAQTDALSPEQIRQLSWSLEETDLDLVVAPMLSDITGPRIHSEPVPGLPLVHMQRPQLHGPQLWMKTAFDYCAAFIGLIVLSPLFLAVAIAIKLDDGGPVFFRQERVGLGQEPFRIWKFRSMRAGSDLITPPETGVAPIFTKYHDDSQVTRVGRFIRKTSLDELPQLLNVIAGHMSLVGPRPLRLWEGAQIEGFVQRRTLVKPGLTGLWQVSGRSEVTGPQAARLDLVYVENWTFTEDIGILLRTVSELTARRGAH